MSRNIVIPVEGDVFTNAVRLGADLPLDNTEDGIFIWNRTNSKIEMSWDGAAWTPTFLIGDGIFYVDSSGTDAQGYGDGSGINAFRTLQYAWDNTPKDGNGRITFVLADETITLSSHLYLTGKCIQSLILGTPTTELSGKIVSSSVTGRRGTITPTIGGMTTNAHTNHILVKTTDVSGNGVNNYPIAITSNTATVITCPGVPSSIYGNTDVFDVYSEGTTISGADTYYVYIGNFALTTFRYIFFDGAIIGLHRTRLFQDGPGPYDTFVNMGGITFHITIFYGCWFTHGVSVSTNSSAAFAGCIMRYDGAANGMYFLSVSRASVYMLYSRMLKIGAQTECRGFFPQHGAMLYVLNTDINDWAYGAQTWLGAVASLQSNTFTSCTYPIYAQTNSTVYENGTNSYTGHTTAETALTDAIII